MGLHHRKLLDCVEDCIGKGPKCCDIPNYYPPTPPSPSYSDNHVNSSSNKHIKTTYLIISFSIVAAAFIIICCYAIYVKFFSPRNRSTRRTLSRPQTEEDFLDEEEYGPVVDHPIWYIRTTGLQQSVIGAITVCNYKKDEGLIEGTECSVCLSEFQEDESLRLLPKCNHAFHLPCIDTWLRSHTNCPMCRAPIVTDPTRVPSMDPNAFASTSFVEEVLETGLDNTQNSSDFLRNEQDEGVQPVPVGENEILGSEVVTVQPRRSVSLDSSSANKISLALATVLAGEFHGNTSNRVVGNGNLATAAKGACSSSSSSTSSVKRSRSFNAKHLLSWYNRSQRKPNPPLRSF